MTVIKLPNGRFAVIDDKGAIVSEHDSNAAAWRAADVTANEPLNKRQAVSDWLVSKDSRWPW